MTTADPRPPRNCYKCGRQIGPDETICAVCNRAGMTTPSATQYHGTIVVAIVAGVAIMAIAASLALRGIGPFHGEAVRWSSDPPDGVVVEVQVSNEGSKPGRARCVLTARDAGQQVLRTRTSLSPQVPAGGEITYAERIPGMTATPASVAVSCG